MFTCVKTIHVYRLQSGCNLSIQYVHIRGCVLNVVNVDCCTDHGLQLSFIYIRVHAPQESAGDTMATVELTLLHRMLATPHSDRGKICMSIHGSHS